MRLRWTWVLAAMLAALALAVAGCGGGDDDDDEDAAADDDATDDDATDDDAADDDAADDDTEPTFDGGWEWVPIDGAICRDGTDTGVMVRASEGSDKLLILLQGGGACYSPSTCADNPSHFDINDAAAKSATLNTGILNNTNDANPVKDWNVIFVPYCTGDVFAGSEPEGVVGGVDGTQAYVGYANMKLFAAEAVDRFGTAANVLLAGESAGGFGTMFNYKTVADAFAPTVVDLFDDSAPLPADDTVLSPCYQLLLTFQFGGEDLVDEVCPDCITPDGDGYSEFAVYYAETYPDAVFGLYSELQDETIRDFFGSGQNDCTGTDLVPGAAFEAALKDLRDNTMEPTGRWGTYFKTGEEHTVVMYDDRFFDDTVDDTTVAEWLTDLLAGTITQLDPTD